MMEPLFIGISNLYKQCNILYILYISLNIFNIFHMFDMFNMFNIAINSGLSDLNLNSKSSVLLVQWPSSKGLSPILRLRQFASPSVAAFSHLDTWATRHWEGSRLRQFISPWTEGCRKILKSRTISTAPKRRLKRYREGMLVLFPKKTIIIPGTMETRFDTSHRTLIYWSRAETQEPS
jgi:hypothetical protein